MKILSILKLFVAILLLGFNTMSCSDSDETHGYGDIQSIKINRGVVSLKVGESTSLFLSYNSRKTEQVIIYWRSEDSNIVRVHEKEDKTCTIEAVGEGETVITAESSNGSLSSSCRVKVTNGKIVRILAIGNSFSEDAVENYLYNLATATGHDVIIGNMYIGGCSLETHVENALNNQANYEYRKINLSGAFSNEGGWSISKVLADENWDYISFQEVSQNSGIYSNFETYLPTLVDYVKTLSSNPKAKYMLHQTWAYAKNSTHSGFANYDKDQMKMYTAIVDAVNRAGELTAIDMIVPAGTAIQNGRTSIIKDNFTKDGYHLDLNIGRFTAACTWFEKIFESSVIDNTYKPIALSDYEAQIAKNAAHYAVLSPSKVTEMIDFQKEEPNVIILDNPIYLDFGRVLSGSPYVNMENATSGRLSNLPDSDGKYSGINIEISKPFNNDNGLGVENTTTGLPSSVTSDAFWSDGVNIPSSGFTLSHLNTSQIYSFSFYGSRKDVSDNRETAYIVEGENEGTAYLNASSNTSQMVSVNGIKPKKDGTITITVKAGPNNNNNDKYFYINYMGIHPGNNTEKTNNIILKKPVVFDFGLKDSGLPFINIKETTPKLYTALTDMEGGQTGIALELVGPFSGDNDLGVENTTTGLPGNVTQDAFWCEGTQIPESTLVLSNLNKSQTYSLSFFGSRKDVTDNRETVYLVKGEYETSTQLNASSNASDIATASNVKPDSSGKIYVTVKPGSNNDTNQKYYYLNAMGLYPQE